MASTVDGYIGKINPGDGINYAIGSTAYGVCETAASTAEKTVDITGFTLVEGATIHVKFVNTNTVYKPSLNVNGTGAKYIRAYEETKMTGGGGQYFYFHYGYVTATDPCRWGKNEVVTLTYDGTYWKIVSSMPRYDEEFNLAAGYGTSTYSTTTTSGNTYLNIVRKRAYPVENGLYADSDSEVVRSKIHLAPGDNIEVTSRYNSNISAGEILINSPGQILIYDIASFSSLPQTVTDSLITADHVLLRSELGTPKAQASDWTVTTAAGSLTVSGTMTSSSSTTMRLVLGIPANPPAST